jgi:thioredoxin 1
VAQELTDVTFYSVNTDRSPGLAQQFGVMSIPTVVLLKNGKEVDRFIGARPKEAVVAFAQS